MNGAIKWKYKTDMMKKCILGLLVLIAVVKVGAQPYIPGNVYYDKNKWVEFIPGTMPLVISVPHGGPIEPSDVPDRSCPDVVTVTDGRTINLALAIEEVFKTEYKVYPSIIICHLKRLKVDMNREIEVATCGNDEMKTPWRFWHEMVDTALAAAINKYGQTIYIDLHGQGHPNQRLELGYLLDNEELQKSSKSDDDTLFTSQSSLHNLIGNSNGKFKLKDMLTGTNAFGTWMQDAGFAATPSKQDPYPYPNEKYFDGGYNVRRFTSEPNVFGWQIESNNRGVRDNLASCHAFAEAFAKNIIRYLATYTNIDIKDMVK